MHELINLDAVERLFTLLAVLIPVLAVGTGAVLQSRLHRQSALKTSALIGLMGPANWLLWRVYNRIEDHYGLDSVKAMLLNIVLFATLGIAVGVALRVAGCRALKRASVPDETSEHLNT